jgi:hypothetical protein
MRGRTLALAYLALLLAGCARKLPPPRWGELERDRAAAVHRLAVVSARYTPAVQPCMLGMTKAMVEAFHLSRRYQVRSYRDVLIALAQPDIDAGPDAPTIDPALGANLAAKLGVDGIVVLSMSRCGMQTGDAVSVGLFATADGIRIGHYETGRPGLAGTGQYSSGANFQAMAQETVEALGRTLDGASAPP